jgi:ferric-dicitrate binding protein FerR (iron transport regulator)
MDIEDLREQLETLLAAKPETGAQWAEICRLEQEISDAEQNAAERAYERQCERFYGGSSPSLRDQQIDARRVK